MAYKKRSERKRRSYGGKAEGPEHQYNAQGSPEDKEEKAKSDGFKRGGSHMKRADGGHVEGHHGHHHMGKRKRGGAMHEEKREEKREHRAHGGHVGKGHHGHAGKGGHHAVHHGRGMARGGSPLSSAHHVMGPGNAKGSPGEQAPLEP